MSICFQRFYLFYFQRKVGREKEREKYQCVVASQVAPTGDLACNPDMFPDWKSNWQPFGSQPVLNPLSYTSQGLLCQVLYIYKVQCQGCFSSSSSCSFCQFRENLTERFFWCGLRSLSSVQLIAGHVRRVQDDFVHMNGAQQDGQDIRLF